MEKKMIKDEENIIPLISKEKLEKLGKEIIEHIVKIKR